MRDGSHVPDTGHEKTGSLEGPDSSLTAGSGAFDKHVYLAKA